MAIFTGKPPKWFKLEKYHELNNYNSKQLCFEIEIRRLQLEALKNNIETINNHRPEKKLNIKTLFDISRTECLFNETYKKWWSSKKYMNQRYEFVLLSHHFDSDFIRLVFPFYDRVENESLVWELKSNSADKLRYYDILDYYSVPKIVDEILIRSTKLSTDDIDSEIDINGIFKKSFIDKLRKNAELLSLEYKFKKYYRKDCIMISAFHHYDSFDDILELIETVFKNTVFIDFIPKVSEELIFTKINIAQPDKILIDNILKLVSDKRKLFPQYDEMPTNIDIYNKRDGGTKEVLRLIDQRIIQYLDLFIWNEQKKQAPTSDWYIKYLYKDKLDNDELVSSNKLNDTVKKVSKNWLKKSWLDSFFHLEFSSYNKIKNK